MTTKTAFLRKAQRELDALLAANDKAPLAGADAYRALVLLARLRDAQSPSEFHGPAVDVADLLRRCVLPDAESVLGDLEAALDGEGDPGGTVHDALLDVDDLAGVLGWTGGTSTRANLVKAARALVQKHRSRLLPLAEWAKMRTSSLWEMAMSWELWNDVANISPPSTGQRRVYPRSMRLPELMLVAAHTPVQEDIPVPDLEENFEATIYLDPNTQERKINIVLPSRDTQDPTSVFLVAVDRATCAALGKEPLTFEREGRDIYISLGSDVGTNSVRHRLCAAIRVDVAAVFFEVRFDENP